MAHPGFRLGESILLERHPEPYRRTPGDPVRRVLRVYTQDPSALRSDGAVAELEVPWEPVGPGPTGRLFVVHDVHKPTGQAWAPVDLDEYRVAADRGLAPSTTDPRFAQQMTYAVAVATYERFREALGRLPEFSPEVCLASAHGRIEIRPHWDEEDNAYYEPGEGAICFGYVKSSAKSLGSTQEGAYVFTSLSHDVVVHEVAHAILDGMRPHLMKPTNPDVAAFHEGFADLVALLMRFRYKNVVSRGIEESKDLMLDATLLTTMAKQWGRTDGDGAKPLRKFLYRQGAADDPIPPDERYHAQKEHHDLGAVLVAAVFEAMGRIFRKKTSTVRKIAAQAPGARDQLIALLTTEARELADQFLNIVIRAVDYCPPLDLTFGEFLRAMVTADWVTVPDDPHHYREALVLAFRRYGITVPGVPDLSEEALRWRGPDRPLDPIKDLAFSALEHRYEPGWFASPLARKRRADAFGAYIVDPAHIERLRVCGLARPGKREGVEYDEPVIESVRTLRRLTPDKDLDFHVVAEVTQRVKRRQRWYTGGATVVIDAEGRVQFVIRKRVGKWERHDATDTFLSSAPTEYRRAFDDDDWSSGEAIRQFHARPRTET